ncbi:ribonuclease HIII [Virgibacillus oceani]|uniref:Ribonuclease HIII n=1 Tax=Virgibacillus oceani TaxID=1479511 RepID=A0A917GYJ4_9BACI|nr:ribonuclease HIII [Virgibacillus oceani]GGG62142.1 ribonuclease HIII [Virgibacillus oceani]
MPQSVHVIPSETIEKMQRHYADSVTNTPKGAIFRAKTPNAVITAYKSGKVLFQGKAPAAEANKWVSDSAAQATSKPPLKTVHSFTPPHALFNDSHAGSDEAGTGDYFGPVTVACVYVKKEQIKTLKHIGVQDSKNLSDTTIRRLSKEILNFNITYSLLVLRNEKYNTLKTRGWSQGKMKAMLHHHTINNVLKKIGTSPLQGILIDQFCEPVLYNKYIASENAKIAKNTYFMTKAESYSIAVACASIIARASFLNEMDELSCNLGLTLPKGASIQVDKTIAKIISKKGKNILNRCAKTHFINTTKAEKYL